MQHDTMLLAIVMNGNSFSSTPSNRCYDAAIRMAPWPLSSIQGATRGSESDNFGSMLRSLLS
ncbi:hypothetical protein ASD03_11460 [Ensifer sp. Root127]|nr:hypothetical protein ASD03_11460 [Ensifer sp. Root127]